MFPSMEDNDCFDFSNSAIFLRNNFVFLPGHLEVGVGCDLRLGERIVGVGCD